MHLRWGAANVDPDEFECPMELRLERGELTLGVGIMGVEGVL